MVISFSKEQILPSLLQKVLLFVSDLFQRPQRGFDREIKLVAVLWHLKQMGIYE
jgi:hypothetical protein